MTKALRLYNICRDDIVLLATMCCESMDTKCDYVECVMLLMDDFFAKYTYDFANMEIFNCYMEVAVLASIWIIDKYIEDEHLYISDITELVRKRVDKQSIILVESEIFLLCKNIRNYIPT